MISKKGNYKVQHVSPQKRFSWSFLCQSINKKANSSFHWLMNFSLASPDPVPEQLRPPARTPAKRPFNIILLTSYLSFSYSTLSPTWPLMG